MLEQKLTEVRAERDQAKQLLAQGKAAVKHATMNIHRLDGAEAILLALIEAEKPVAK